MGTLKQKAKETQMGIPTRMLMQTAKRKPRLRRRLTSWD